jgi:CRISPR-associated protein Cas1
MRKLQNTLYITNPDAYVACRGQTLEVRVEKETRLQIPVHTLEGLVCFGEVGMSPFAMSLCAEHGVGVSFHTRSGRFMARVQGPVSGNVLLRRTQYRVADDPDGSAEIARSVLLAKVLNTRGVLMRASREASDEAVRSDLNDAAARLMFIAREMEQAGEVGTLRGLEGEAARRYFGAFNHLISEGAAEFRINGRNRRPPLNPMNAMLSFLYALLAGDVASALESVGLDPAVGFLHSDRPGRKGLALDLMEEFRACIADRLALSMVNRGQVKAKQFETSYTGAVTMADELRKAVIVAYQERKKDEIHHPFLGEQVSIGLLPYCQAMLLARHLRGDLDGYPPFFWK